MRATPIVLGFIILYIALAAAAFVYGGELGNFMLTSLEALPFLLLAALAQAGEKRAWARVLTYLWLVLLVLGFAVLCLAYALIAVTVGNPSGLEAPSVGPTLLRVFGAVLLALLVAVPALFRAVRVALSRLMPISPDSLVHKVALFILVYITIAAFGQLAALGGRPPLLDMASLIQESAAARSSAEQILGLTYEKVWILPMALVAAGYPLRRVFADAIRRLGFTLPSRAQTLIGLGLAIALVGLSLGMDNGLAYIWQLLGWPTTNLAAFDQILGAGLSPVGAVVIGVSAGIGEEVATRGLLQPRLGKLLPNLAFVSIHAFQYGPDALISVFILGMIFAYVRAWSNTTVAALVHGTYDFLSVLMSVLGINI